MGPAETITQLDNATLLLRALVHAIAGRIELEPRFEAKGLLADHLHDDADALEDVVALGANQSAPAGPHLGELIATLHAGDLDLLYGRIKPAFGEALETLAADLDPLLDEPALHVVLRLAHAQRRHAAELPGTNAHPPVAVAMDEPHGAGEAPAAPVLPRPSRPARDPYVEEDPGADATTLHALVHARLCAVEAAARAVHEQPRADIATVRPGVRSAWDAARHARALECTMAEDTGVHWGEQPVAFGVEATYSLASGAAAELVARIGRETSGAQR